MGAFRGVTERYGSITELLRNVMEPLRKISILPITNWILNFGEFELKCVLSSLKLRKLYILIVCEWWRHSKANEISVYWKWWVKCYLYGVETARSNAVFGESESVCLPFWKCGPVAEVSRCLVESYYLIIRIFVTWQTGNRNNLHKLGLCSQKLWFCY